MERDVVGTRISQPSGDGGKKGIGVGIWRFPKVRRAMGEAFAGVSDRSWRPLTSGSFLAELFLRRLAGDWFFSGFLFAA